MRPVAEFAVNPNNELGFPTIDRQIVAVEPKRTLREKDSNKDTPISH